MISLVRGLLLRRWRWLLRLRRTLLYGRWLRDLMGWRRLLLLWLLWRRS